jgi:hypothetical protein
MSVKARPVKLIGGPHGGGLSVASHNAVLVGTEVYVQNGSDDPDAFAHAPSVLRKLPEEQRQRERIAVRRFLKTPRPGLIAGIPKWRVNAWVQVIRNNCHV